MNGQNEKPICRFCAAPEAKQSIKGNYVYGGTVNQHFWECADCKIIYLYPPMSEEDEARFYNQEFEKYMSSRAGQDMDWSGPEAHVRSNQREVSRRMPMLEKFIKPGMKVLELGCSSGFMLSALKERGCEVYGIDPSGGFIDFVQSRGIKIFHDLDELKVAENVKFDLIIHYYVFEHIRHPVDFLRQHMELLNKGGAMVFEVPCATDPLSELYQVEAFDKFYWSVAHHWYFRQESLRRVLDQAGFSFELFPEQRYDISNHMTWMLNGKPGGYQRWSHIFGAETDNAYKAALKKNWLCDTIIAILRK